MTLALFDATSHVATQVNPNRFDRDMLDHDRDLLTMYGVAFEERLLRSGRHVSFSELAETALIKMPTSAFASDLVIVAYGVPDLSSITAVAAHVNLLLGGNARAFAVSEQGLHAPFTAVRIVSAFAGGGRTRKATLLVLEQSTRPHWDDLVHGTPLVDSVAVLVFRGDIGYHAGAVDLIGDDDEALRSELIARVRRNSPERPLVVAGPWVADRAVADLPEVHRVPPGSYATSVWRALADNHRDWLALHDRIILCDTDPRHHRSSVAELSRMDQPSGSTGRST